MSSCCRTQKYRYAVEKAELPFGYARPFAVGSVARTRLSRLRSSPEESSGAAFEHSSSQCLANL
jgi:hypothetical protein